MMRSIFLLSLLSLLVACGSGSNVNDVDLTSGSEPVSESASNSQSANGSLSLRLTDAPVDNAAHVNISIKGISLNRQNEDGTDDEAGGWTDYNIETTPPQIDLLVLQNGNTFELLENEEVAAGSYKIRLNLNFDDYTEDELIQDPLKINPPNSIVIDGDDVAGSTYELTIPGGRNTGLKLNSPIQVTAGACADYTIDFDVRRSVVLRGNQRNNNGYLLKPVLRVVDNASAAAITGRLPTEDLLPDGCVIADADGDGSADDISVYVFEGDVQPDDYDDKDAEAITSVTVNTNGIFSTAPLPKNKTYTVAFTCEANLEDLDADDTDPEGPRMLFTKIDLMEQLQGDIPPGQYRLEPVNTSCSIDDLAPTAVLDIRDTNGQILTNNRINLGDDFVLDGSRSVDAGGGEIVTYRWTHIDSGFEAITNDPSINASLILQGLTLPLGQHAFSLEVEDNSGNVSNPALVNVIIIDTLIPTAVLDIRDINGPVVTNNQINFGEDFILDGSRSTDPGSGEIVAYRWTHIDSGFEATTNDPSINASLILQGLTLPLGQHAFSLEVEDNSGNVSNPALVNVIIIDTLIPTAVLDIRDINGPVVTNNQINFGEDFILDGSRSTDPGSGEIVTYRWTHIDSGFEATTNDPSINASLILQGLTLPLGQHAFILEVEDNSGNVSNPALVLLTVV